MICMVWCWSSENECTCVEEEEDKMSTEIKCARLGSGSAVARNSSPSSLVLVTVKVSLHFASVCV